MLLGLPWTSMGSLAQWLEPYLLPGALDCRETHQWLHWLGLAGWPLAYRALGIFKPSTSLVSGLLPVVLSIWLMAF